MVILSDNGLQVKTVTRDKRGCYIMQGSISRRFHNYKYIYTPSFRAPKYMKQTLTKLKGEMHSSALVVIFNILILIKYRTTR